MRYGTLQFPNRTLRVEVVETAEERARGLAGRPGLSDDDGMIFPGTASIWMVGMLFPLDLIFLSVSRPGSPYSPYVVVRTVRWAVPGTPTIHTFPGTFAVLEVAGGWVARHDVRLGQSVFFVDG